MAGISVIIPAFNRKELLGQTLDSLSRQTLKPSEIIVVDDHSIDGTCEFVKKNYPDVVLAKNRGKGPGAARNHGLSLARGAYVKFFDSDDVMTKNSLEVQLNTLNASGKQFVYSPYFKASQDAGGQWHAADNIVMHFRPFGKGRSLTWFMIVDGLFITIPGMLFTRDVVNEAGPWREDVTAYEDFDYLFRLSLIEPSPAHNNECAFVYRVHGAQSTENNLSDEQRDLDKIRVLNDLGARAGKLNRLQEIVFVNKFYELFRHSRSAKIRRKLQIYNSLTNRLVGEALRMKWRMGRFATGTSWQPSHGPLKSPSRVLQYLAQL